MKLFIIFVVAEASAFDFSSIASAAAPVVDFAKKLFGSKSDSGSQNGSAPSPSITSNPNINIANTVSPDIQQSNNAPVSTNLNHNQRNDRTETQSPTMINDPYGAGSNYGRPYYGSPSPRPMQPNYGRPHYGLASPGPMQPNYGRDPHGYSEGYPPHQPHHNQGYSASHPPSGQAAYVPHYPAYAPDYASHNPYYGRYY